MISLREWLVEHDVWLDDRLELTGPPLHVYAREAIPPHATIARIPKSIVLSHRTSTLRASVPTSRYRRQLDALAPALRLAVHVLWELSIGERSRWYGYFEHLPRNNVEIGLLWTPNGKANRWTRGTELEKERDRIGVSRDTLAKLYDALVVPLFRAAAPSSTLPLGSARKPSSCLWQKLVYAYSIVSSRAFQVDAFHSLALVPFADAFDHDDPDNEVQFESETWVCTTCGAVAECRHDRDQAGSGSDDGEVANGMGNARSNAPKVIRSDDDRRTSLGSSGTEQDTCDMTTTSAPIVATRELHNSYGPLSNARLVAEYGFALEANPWDLITFDLDDLSCQRWSGSSDDATKFELDKMSDRHGLSHVRAGHPLIAYESASSDPVSRPTRRSLDLSFDAEAKISYPLWTWLARSALHSRLDDKSTDASDRVESNALLPKDASSGAVDQDNAATEANLVDEIERLAGTIARILEEREALLGNVEDDDEHEDQGQDGGGSSSASSARPTPTPEGPLVPNDQSLGSRPFHPCESDLDLISRIAIGVCDLVDRRVRSQHRPELTSVELLDLLESGDYVSELEDEGATGAQSQDDLESGRQVDQVKLAVELVANERILLERVRANWVDLIRP
ncbi:hypothetical protein JCM10212_000798 [Sporobolomyces blumeae]